MRKQLRPEVSQGMKTIGILGGLGPQATMRFEEQIHKISQKHITHFENQGYPPIAIYYIRHQPFVLYADNTRPLPLQPHLHLLEGARILGTIADFLVIPSNTPHFFQHDIEKASGKNVVSMIATTIGEIKKRNSKSVGILAMGHTVTSDLYQKPLTKQGVRCELITDDALGQRLDDALFRVMQGDETEKDSMLAVDAINHLRSKNVDAIIIACTELPFLLKNQQNESDLINPSQYLAEAAVLHAMDKN